MAISIVAATQVPSPPARESGRAAGAALSVISPGH